jgi:uncharacterized protein with HEPN domain
MSRRDDVVPMRQMVEYARHAIAIATRWSRADLDSDVFVQLALRQAIQIVGEAANRVSPERRARHPGIPWPDAISVRNRIVHGYDDIDYDILWRIVTEEFPRLIVELERALAGPSA